MNRILYLVSGTHLILSQFTKVEESFNIQAIHDILHHKTNLSQYDHLEFPGVVPRTFLGPILISVLSYPIFFFVNYLEYFNKFINQLLVRAILNLIVVESIKHFHKTIEKVFGSGVGNWFIIITSTQFHVMYYSSRPLPNIMAFPLVMIAISSWITGKYKTLIWSSAAAILIFRSELVIYLGIILLIELFYKRLTILRGLKIGFVAAIVVLTTSVIIDSLFWRRLVWPEGEVLFFNTILNKSSQWGTQPFLWYFYSAIPRGIGFSLCFIPLGMIYDIRVTRLVLPAFMFVLIYSILPHKELRFIIYVFPVLNISVASYCNRIWQARFKTKGLKNLIALVFCISHIFGNLIFTIILSSAAIQNYPGGHAMLTLHKVERNNLNANYSIHIDNLPAQTGVTRFTQLSNQWTYSKKENLKPGCEELMSFTHLVIGSSNRDNEEMLPYKHSHHILFSVPGFSYVSLNYNTFPPLKIKTKTQIFVLKKNSIKSGVKQTIKKIVEEFKNAPEKDSKIDLQKNAKQKLKSQTSD